MTAPNPLAPLAAYRQFIVVKLVPLPDGRTDKIPLTPDGQVTPKGSRGAHDPTFWLSWQEAYERAVAWGVDHGVGFVITADDPFFCVDIDGAATPAGWSPLALKLCGMLPGCVVEISQSGQGLHIWGRATHVPQHAAKNQPLHLECYSELRFILLGRDQAGTMADDVSPQLAQVIAEYFPPRVTAAAGLVMAEGPSPDWRGPSDDDDLIRRALAARSMAGAFGGKAVFADLWEANGEALARTYPGNPYDGSSADMALAQHLAFWTGRDKARMLRLMRRSKLVREKWDRDDYLPMTIENACALQTQVCQDKPTAPAPSDGPAPMEKGRIVKENTFLGIDGQLDLFKGCTYVTSLDKILMPDGALLNQSRFRAFFGGRTFTMDATNSRSSRNAWEAFTESQAIFHPKVDGVCYRPQDAFGTVVDRGPRKLVNTYLPPRAPRVPGDVAPFLTHLAKLLPVEADRTILLCYMAACVQHAGTKFQWAPLIQGVEGNGKSFLSRALAYAVGEEHTHWPKASKIAKQFNGWMVGKVLYCVEDVYTTEHVDVMEELKPMITNGDGLEIEKKGIDQVSEDVVGNFMLNTNHLGALRKTRNDRRIAPFHCAQRWVDDLARDGLTGTYYRQLYDWARAEGYAHIAHHLATMPIPDDLNPARGLQRAPHTSATEEAIEASRGSVEQEILEKIDAGVQGFAGGWVSSTYLSRLLESMRKASAVPLSRRREMMRSLGYDYHPALGESGRVNNSIMPDGCKPRLFVKHAHPALALTVPGDVAKAYSQAQEGAPAW